MTEHEWQMAIRQAYLDGVRAGKVIPLDDEAREHIWHEINEARHQMADAIMSRLTEVLWPNGITTHTSCAHQRPMRFYPDLVEVEVMPIKGKGRGVVARWPIKAGTLIETAPVKPFDFNQPMPDALADLPMAWTDTEDCITMGAVQFMNHSDNPNCRLERDIEALTIKTYALRDIAAEEELTYRYLCPVWWNAS